MLRVVGLLALVLGLSCLSRSVPTRSPATLETRTFWKVCFDKNGKVKLPSDEPPHFPRCKNWEVIKWPNVPIKVGIGRKVDLKAAHTAITVWNDALGFKIFELSPPAEDLNVVIFQTKPMYKILGRAIIGKPKGRLLGIVVLHGFETRVDVLVHELGHILGLGHDVNDVFSVMYPTMLGGSIIIQPEDIKAIRELYRRN